MNTAKIMTRQMRLSELLMNEITLPQYLDTELTGIELDSRKVEPGDLFFACKGATRDGREFIDDAISQGASAVLVEYGDEYLDIEVRRSVPLIPIQKLGCRVGKLAARFFDYPARELWMIGITGTNGKTSCSQFIAQCYSQLGTRCGVSGTLGFGIYGDKLKAETEGPGTTPDPIAIQRIIEEVKFNKAGVMAMEVSSHGLQQRRVNVSDFNVAVFTNLTHEHLDYHGSMDVYGKAKRMLFEGPHLDIAVVNLDDIFSATILNTLARNVKSYTYSLSNPRASVYPKKLTFHQKGFSMQLQTPWGSGEVDSRLLGAFNASNLLAAATTVLASEIDKGRYNFVEILEKISAITPVRGRMEIIGEGPLHVVVDYAHTPDALRNALLALKQHYEGRIWCVFGCGGNRDQAKRPQMARVAETLADRIVITDDNPRREASETIIQQIMSGIQHKDKVTVLNDRAQAIEFAINAADSEDVVLIAGKGHEEYQDVGGNRMVFSDVKQARLSLNKRYQQ